MKQLLVVISGAFSIIIGLWKYFGRKAATKRKILKEAKEDLDNAHKNKDSSSILDAWGKSRRV